MPCWGEAFVLSPSRAYRFSQQSLSIQLMFTGIHIFRLIVAEALVLCSEQVVVEHKEVRVIARADGALACLDAELPGAIDGVAQNYFFV